MFIDIEGTKLFVDAPDNLEGKSALFFLYGLGCSNFHWTHQQNFFRKTYPVIWYDYRGHGSSGSDPKIEITIDRLTQDTIAVIRALKLKSVTLFGQSMGGSLALSVASKAPDLVESLILVGSPTRAPSQTMQFDLSGKIAWKGMMLLNQMAPRFLRKLYQLAPFVEQVAFEVIRQRGFNPSLSQSDEINRYLKELLAVDPNIFWRLAEDLESFDVYEWIHTVIAPALVIAGGRDNLVPLSESKRLVQNLARGELFTLPHGSHCPHFDDPGEVNRAIESFLQKYKIGTV